MKIRVLHEDGRIETLTLKGLLRVSEGVGQNRIKTESGMELFFSKDGHYDGWGAVSESQQADEIIATVESCRDFARRS